MVSTLTNKYKHQRSTLLLIAPVLLLCACVGVQSPGASRLSELPLEPVQINYLPPTTNDAGQVDQQQQFVDDTYNMLVAELAFYRGDIELSVQYYLILAQSQNNPDIAARATRIALYAENFDAALKAAKRHLELSPNSLDTQKIIVAIYISQGKATEAFHHLDQVLASNQISDEALFTTLLDMLTREKNTELTLEVTQLLVDNYPEKSYAQYLHGMLLVKAGALESALSYFEKALQLEQIENAYGVRANVLLKLGRREAAVLSLKEAVEAHPNSREIGLTYARLLIDISEYAKARTEFEKLYKIYPNDGDLLYTLGLLSLEARHLDDAEKYLSTLVELKLRNGEAEYYLGRIFEDKEQFDQAIKWYRLVSADQYQLDAQLRIAIILGSTDRISEAREYLEQIRQDSQNNDVIARTYMSEGEILSTAEHFAEAMAVYDAALKIYPANIDLLFARAMLAEKIDRLDILEVDMNAILVVQPNNAHALNALGFTLADRTDRYEEAYDLLERAIKLMPENAAIVDSFGWVNYRLGNYDIAIKLLRTALELQYDNEIAAHLGEVLWVTGNQQEAKDIWNEALEKTPEDQRIQKLMQRLIQ